MTTLKNRLTKKANIIAREYGAGRATEVIIGLQNRVVRYVPNGYRKNTTDEYVAKCYVTKRFGLKNYYYQNMECAVEVNPHS